MVNREPERTPQTAPDLEALPYPENEGGTHWEGCWRAPRHHNCAVREAFSARAERDAARAEVERLKARFDRALTLIDFLTSDHPAFGRLTAEDSFTADYIADERAALSTEAAQ